MIAAAMTAHYQNVMIIHLHGGEKSGSADDAVRHAISKLSTYHFVSSVQSKQRLLSMGEQETNIFVIGSLRKHDIQEIRRMSKEEKLGLTKKLNLGQRQKKILFVVHPDSKDNLPFFMQINESLEAMKDFTEAQLILLGTNSDTGGEIFRKSINTFVNQYKNVAYFDSLPPSEYLFLLSQVDVLVGNSSSGIIEAPFFNVPFVNIGNRQRNREHGENVIHVKQNAADIKRGIQKALASEWKNKKNPYDVAESPAEEMVKVMRKLLHL